MLVRLRWFLLGVVATLGGGFVAFGRYMRRRLTPAAVRRAAGRYVAAVLDHAADAIEGTR